MVEGEQRGVERGELLGESATWKGWLGAEADTGVVEEVAEYLGSFVGGAEGMLRGNYRGINSLSDAGGEA